MSKRVLISLMLVVVLLFSAALPAWVGPAPLVGAGDTESLVGPGLIHPMGGCEDPSAGGCSI
jgi:hypothetical protein